jgi:xanthine dehydrogenase/oxidase
MSVTTVEGLGTARGHDINSNLHPVQERMAIFAGSQCGFCTPGFVMSMYSHLQNHSNPNAEELQKSLDGNLCRCTGYRPIIDAVKSISSIIISNIMIYSPSYFITM